MVSQQISGGEVFSLLAVPNVYIWCIDIMSMGHTSNRLLDLVNTFVGHIKGGLAITTAATCTFFGAIQMNSATVGSR